MAGKVSVADNLTPRQQKWFASVQASLERDTGRSLDEWVAIARTCPETTSGKRSEWLRLNHGLGVNRAAHVLSVAFPEPGWDDADALRAALWTDAAGTAILEAVERAVADLPVLVTGQRKTFTAWSRNFQFAALKPVRGGAAVLGLAVPPQADARLAPPKNEGWSERLKSRLALQSPADVDAGVAALLHAAWERS
jgi:hypothetical protein